MIIVDSFGWIEYLSNGPLAGKYEKYLSDLSGVVTPSIVVYEVYKKVKKTKGEETALIVAGQLMKTRTIALDNEIALSAAELSLRHSLPLADAVVYATGIKEKCQVVTSDPHFRDLENVIFIK
ncbi:VapC toxin family PIN domain ribonuclease [Candidatus Desantisbacteria bacterium CG_4_10_14_0_8_um_filter_48_22]|uniref:VapC toxin family PIN domain ribonuclease n=1 Tax=Candidatus Desantisbacteria bacterium CG_4_10_14_0_8_um_filter_48_22 TaxID=1974543 RepID=A0A2M7S861_9BACT|nr:MAG: VapC toxin family PIN domain ribonuclease [Candidatus Desantisbacteria bacterium CG02_land_8_20_14_3_00_49_13]PIZ15697.1 MAG: VapC toxin family PIN domain ribonuclease [Candidatus Desantisbacteria bacterium CG_4_10_14_0_8_um_filter_48_22]